MTKCEHVGKNSTVQCFGRSDKLFLLVGWQTRLLIGRPGQVQRVERNHSTSLSTECRHITKIVGNSLKSISGFLSFVSCFYLIFMLFCFVYIE